MSSLPTTIDPTHARLPATYEAARTAIAECERIDECKTWADKAAALASYARQANDDDLRVKAIRIQARATRRCGELLKQIEPANGANQNIQDGAVPKVTRTQAATDAGLSERQRKTALRLASVPEAEFERQLESSSPPTVTELSGQGTMEGLPHPRVPSASAVLEFAAFCEQHEPTTIAAAWSADLDNGRARIGNVVRWLEQFARHLPR